MNTPKLDDLQQIVSPLERFTPSIIPTKRAISPFNNIRQRIATNTLTKHRVIVGETAKVNSITKTATAKGSPLLYRTTC